MTIASMAPLSSVTHVGAVTGALIAAQLTVYLGGAPQGAGPPYAVLYPHPGAAVRASLADDRVNFRGIVQITCVGAAPEQAANYVDRAAGALAGAIAGGRPDRVAAGSTGR